MFKKSNLSLKFFEYLRPHWRIELLVIILSVVAVLLDLVNPYLTKLIIDKAIGGKDLNKFVLLVFISALVFVINSLVKALYSYFEKNIRLKVLTDISKKIFSSLEGLSLNWFRGRSSGEHVYKINYDSEKIAEFITVAPYQVIVISAGAIFICSILFMLNWKLTVLGLAAAPFLFLLQYYFSRRIRESWAKVVKNSERLFKKLTEIFSRIQLIKVFGTENNELKNYFNIWLINIGLKRENIKLDISSVFVNGIVCKIVIGSIAFYGGWQVIEGKITLGTITAIIVYLTQLFGLADKLFDFWRIAIRGSVSCSRVNAILTEIPQVAECKEAREEVFKEPQIKFKQVSFGYKQELILKNVSFGIDSGSYVAIAGRSGCGKTTLLNLMLRLFDPQEGKITIDGYGIDKLTFRSLKSQIGFAMQEPFLLDDSVKNNIKYGFDNVTDEEIIRAARLTGADEFTNELSEKYDTIIGESGCTLSEGQKQRIAISRALIRKPKVIILDEAMSSMDSQSEVQVMNNIRANYKDATIIIVSHRLSAVCSANLVYFIKKPDEILIGKPHQLLQEDKEFYDLFASQLKKCTV